MFTSLAVLALLPGSPLAGPPDAAAPATPAPASPALARRLYLLQDEEAEAAEEPPAWHGSVDLGASTSNGNSQVITAAASALAQKEWDDNRVTFKGNWAFAEQQDNATGQNSVTKRQWTGSGKYDRFWNEKTYWYASAKYDNDDIALLHLRQTYSLGVGHKFADDEDYKLDGELGLAYVDENYFSSTFVNGSQADDEYIAFRAAYALFWQISEDWVFLQDVELFPGVDFSDFNGTKDSRLKHSLTENMYFQVQWLVKYSNTNAPGTASTDTLWAVALGWTY